MYEYVHEAPVQVLLQVPAASVHTGCHVDEPGVWTWNVADCTTVPASELFAVDDHTADIVM